MSDTPQTDKIAKSLLYEKADKRDYELRKHARQLERERDEWKAKFIQQNKDLGCEMMDPAGTIWDHAKKLQDENKALREQYRLSSVCRELKEENERLKRLVTWPHDVDPFTSPDHDNESRNYP